MSEKVKVSREIAEALESARKIRSDETLTDMCISRSFVSNQEPLNNLNPYTLVKILINGYEIEPTPEELILKEYNRLKSLRHSNDSNENVKNECIAGMHAMVYTLNKLNIEIEGINA